MSRSVHYLKLLGGAAFASLMISPAFAQAVSSGTAANTDIVNRATVNYTVGGAAQSASSLDATFKVDRKVNLQVAEVGNAATQTSLGSLNQVTTFTVTNLTNSTQDFILSVDQRDLSLPIVGADNFNVTGVRIYVDNGDNVFDINADTLANFIDELPQDATRQVYVVANIPADDPNARNAIVTLEATVAVGGTVGQGAVLEATPLTDPDRPQAVDTVFADDGLLLDLRNGRDFASDAYSINTAAVRILKTSRVISDPVSLLNPLAVPKAIPGAVVEYCLALSNAGPGTATALTVTDALPANVTYVANSLRVGGISLTGGCTLDGLLPEDNDATGIDETDLYGGSFDGTTVRATLPAVLPAVALNVSFLVTIN